MTAKDAENKISRSTPITTALAISLCAGSFWSGSMLQSIRTKVDAVAARQHEILIEEQDWRKQTADILSELKQLGRDNKIRIDYLSKEYK